MPCLRLAPLRLLEFASICLAAACNSPGSGPGGANAADGGARDLTVVFPDPDLAEPPDLTRVDLVTPPDLTRRDLTLRFARPTKVQIQSPLIVAGGDLDGDGMADLAVATTAQQLRIFFSKGDGTFAASASFPLGHAVESLLMVDLDGDGSQDVLVGLEDGTVAPFYGNGRGTLAADPAIPASGKVAGIVAGDFNNDRRLDLALATGTDAMVLRQTSARVFGSISHLVTGKEPNSLATGDFSGDGKLDLAVANQTDGTVSLFQGDGIGGFKALQALKSARTPSQVLLADSDKDGLADLFVVAPGALGQLDNVDRFAAVKGGPFAAASPLGVVGSQIWGASLADFDLDGNLDCAELSGDPLVVRRGTAGGMFLAPASVTSGVAFSVSFASADFTGDGLVDLAIADLSLNQVAVVLNTSE